MQVGRQEGGVSILVDLDAPESIEVMLAFDGGAVMFRGLTRHLGEIDSLEITDGSITWTQSGHHRVAVTVDLRGDTPPKFDLQISADGEPLYRVALPIPEAG